MSVAPIPPSILLADGDAHSREVFGSFFKSAGWSYDVVTNGHSVSGALEAHEYDIIIADVAMPGVDGMELLREILGKRPGQAVIAVSADGSFDDALEFFRCGATDLLPRPVDFKWLDRVVRQVVQNRRQDIRERRLYKFAELERTQFSFSSNELAELDTFGLPIVNRLLAAGLLDQGAALKLRLAVQEAIINGLEHGNLELPSEWKEELLADGSDRFSSERRGRLADPAYSERQIRVVSDYDGEMLSVTISDDGKGFLNGSSTPFQPKQQSIACSGRGLALMSSAVDEVLFSRNGSEVTLRKKIRNSTE